MRKLIHVLNINDFFPELFALTFPTIKAYADRTGFTINLITERKFPNYPNNYDVSSHNLLHSSNVCLAILNDLGLSPVPT